MDIHVTAVLSLFLALLLVMPSFSIPLDVDRSQEEQVGHLEEKRPKYMDTRELGDMMKDLVYDALKDLVNEGKVNPDLLTPDFDEVQDVQADSGNIEKRRRHLGLCLRRRGSKFLPYPCYKFGRRR